ncbi:MAG: hypothetical protein CME06_00185 [Gemmatimonadetes bacterium]|nr:hypothetical protein [Gemmatimonadota bacterium]
MISKFGKARVFHLVAPRGRGRRWFICLWIVAFAGCAREEAAQADLERIGELLSHRLREDAAPERRRAAARGIGAIQETEALSALEAALADDDPAVRTESIHALARLGAPGPLPSIAAALENDAAEEVRAAAATALGELLATPRSPPPEGGTIDLAFRTLARATAEDRSPVVRVAAVSGLGVALAGIDPAARGGPAAGAIEAATDVIVAAVESGGPAIRAAAAATDAATKALLAATESASSAIRAAAAKALGPALSTASDPQPIRSRLAKLLTVDTAGPVRSAAAEALGFARGAEIDLARALRDDPLPSVRRSAALALGNESGAVATGALIEASADSDPIVRWSAVHSLALVPRGRDHLRKPSRRGGAGVEGEQRREPRRGPPNRVSDHGDREPGARVGAAPAIERALDDADPIVRQRAAEALRSIWWPSARPRLLELATAPSEPATVRAPAILALASTPRMAPATFERLTLLLEGDEEQILLATLRALSEHPDRLRADPRIVPRLLRHLRGGFGEVRVLAAGALGATGERSAADALREMLGADDARERLAAAHALAAIADGASIQAITALAEQEEPEVAEELRSIVRKMER